MFGKTSLALVVLKLHSLYILTHFLQLTAQAYVMWTRGPAISDELSSMLSGCNCVLVNWSFPRVGLGPPARDV